ncbi:AraC family transcriptional regulator [Microvirga massiliensis]|uniref:AraC family transcriptional regulator n=1 Tax=Microvirga massiliensis TaxID=1033741 RepID=UPI0009E416FD|nr:AraC family transcriptional regulator [Microvirga massiliensis]
MTRLAAARLRHLGHDPVPVLRKAGLSLEESDNPEARLDVGCQIALLGLAAEMLKDDVLGFHLAEAADLREAGLLYFVLASSTTFREALERAERYSTIANEAITLRCLRGREVGIDLDYVGVPRHADRHQIEFVATVLVRMARQTTGTALRPIRVAFVHPRCTASQHIEAFFACPIAFGSACDVIAFAPEASEFPLTGADPYLNNLLVGYCEEALAHRSRPVQALRTRVENATTPLLPHGKARAGEVARKVGLSQRTLARRLAAEGLTFARILNELRADLAQHYLQDSSLSVSEVAWLLGFQEVSAFTHACKRWTGRTPSQVRSQETRDLYQRELHRSSMTR